TPWLTSAIEERLGGQHRIEVGGTMLERDEVGRSALRLRDIVVRDAHGTVVASAPKAEVGVSSLSLLTGRVQTERLSLIGAETSTPKPHAPRMLRTVFRDVAPKDLVLARRANDGHFSADVPLSAVIRAEIERDGTLQLLEGRILAGAGYFGSRDDPDSRIHIDEAQLNLRWNAATRQLLMPLDAQSGPSRVNLMAQLDVPEDSSAPWSRPMRRSPRSNPADRRSPMTASRSISSPAATHFAWSTGCRRCAMPIWSRTCRDAPRRCGSARRSSICPPAVS